MFRQRYISLFVCLMVFNATSNNISVVSWWSVLLVEETGRPGDNHQPVASHWQTLLHNVVHLALIEIRIHRRYITNKWDRYKDHNTDRQKPISRWNIKTAPFVTTFMHINTTNIKSWWTLQCNCIYISNSCIGSWSHRLLNYCTFHSFHDFERTLLGEGYSKNPDIYVFHYFYSIFNKYFFFNFN